MKWFIATTYSGYEQKVKKDLLERINKFHMENSFGEIYIPSENVTQKLKNGKSKVKTKSTFPGYLFIQMNMNEKTWYFVKNTPKVTGFIGNKNPNEVTDIHINNLKNGIAFEQRPLNKREFEPGDNIKIISGAFLNFAGTIKEINADKQKMKILVNIFGRETAVDIDFKDVENPS